jgi:hypothetical protein
VRLHDALGRAGGAAGIDDVERGIGRDGDGPRARAGGRQPVVEGLAGCRAVQRDARQRGSGAGRRGWASASTNSRRAPASRSIEARASAVAEGASGATATPARSAPMNSAA